MVFYPYMCTASLTRGPTEVVRFLLFWAADPLTYLMWPVEFWASWCLFRWASGRVVGLDPVLLILKSLAEEKMCQYILPTLLHSCIPLSVKKRKTITESFIFFYQQLLKFSVRSKFVWCQKFICLRVYFFCKNWL